MQAATTSRPARRRLVRLALGTLLLLAGWRLWTARPAPTREGPSRAGLAAPAAPAPTSRSAPVTPPPAPASDDDPALAAFAPLAPEDVEWVLDEVARAEAARSLTEQERQQLLSELASIRTFAVLEREEPMTPPVEEGSP